MAMDGSSSQRFRAFESARTHNLSASTIPPWAALKVLSFLNVLAGIFILVFLGRSSSLVTGFAACLVFLGISYVGWFAAGVQLWKRNLVGLSCLAIASSVSAALCILMRMLLSSQAATGFSSKAFQVVRDPFELARLWASSARWLTFLSFFYAATSAFLFFRFRRVWIFLRARLLAGLLLPDGQMRLVLLWWLAISSLGVALSVFLADLGHFQITPYGTAAFVAILVLLGALQALASCWVISLLKVQNKPFLMSLGSLVGILTAFGVLVLGMTFLYVYAAVGFWSFGLTGILFGSMAGHAQWRSLVQSHKSP